MQSMSDAVLVNRPASEVLMCASGSPFILQTLRNEPDAVAMSPYKRVKVTIHFKRPPAAYRRLFCCDRRDGGRVTAKLPNVCELRQVPNDLNVDFSSTADI